MKKKKKLFPYYHWDNEYFQQYLCMVGEDTTHVTARPDISLLLLSLDTGKWLK